MNNQQPNISNGRNDMPSTGSVQENPMNDIRDENYLVNKDKNNNSDHESGLNENEIEETSKGVA